MAGLLEGINILDFGMAGVGPWANTLLGLMGANVIKIERPDGDVIQFQAPLQNGLSVAYSAWNMSKKNATLNLKVPEGHQALEHLLKQADVICENQRPGAMNRLGLSFEDVRKINPKIVYASSPAWGFDGPMANWPGVDSDVQVFSGFASMTGVEGGRPEMARHAFNFDLNASCILAATVLLGLLRRDQTGEAQYVTNTHLGGTLLQLASRMAEYLLAGNIPGPLGSASAFSAPHQAFQCEDKRWLSLGVETEEQWRSLCRAVRREELLEDKRFTKNIDRVEHRKELAEELKKTFASRPSRWWFVQLTKGKVPVGYYFDFEDLRANQAVAENNYIVETEIPHQGKLFLGGVPWQFSSATTSVYPAPAPGQHTKETLEKGFETFGPAVRRELRNGHKNDPGPPPLSGIRVIDATQGLCGPFLSLLLADTGAEVIKVEPPEGDYARGFAPQTKSGDSAAFTLLNRNKKSVALDKETDEGRNSLKQLLSGADIFIEDWEVGEAQSLGLDYDTLRQSNPGLIYCAITPFGEKGVYKDMKGSELVIQGMSDYWLSVGEIGSEPTRWGSEVASGGTAAMALPAILASLYNRNRTGEGQRIAISLWGTMLCYRQACWTLLGDIEDWVGPFCQAYTYPRMHGWRTKDKPIYLRLYNASEEDYVGLLLDLGMEEALADERFGNGGRDAVGTGPYAQELIPFWESYLKSMTAAEVAELVWSHNAVAFPMNNAKEVFHHPQVKALGVLKEMAHPVLGKIQVIGPPFAGSWEPPTVTPAPKLDENRAEMLSS